MTLCPRTVRIFWEMFSSRRGDRNVMDCGSIFSIMPVQASIIVPDSNGLLAMPAYRWRAPKGDGFTYLPVGGHLTGIPHSFYTEVDTVVCEEYIF